MQHLSRAFLWRILGDTPSKPLPKNAVNQFIAEHKAFYADQTMQFKEGRRVAERRRSIFHWFCGRGRA